jgi:hypothetical protein
VTFIDSLTVSPFVEKLKTKYGPPLGDPSDGADATEILNYGYEDDPPMALPLAESDEPNRFCIRQYHRTTTLVGLSGKEVLELGCGHGGGSLIPHPHLVPGLLHRTGLEPGRHRALLEKAQSARPGFRARRR